MVKAQLAAEVIRGRRHLATALGEHAHPMPKDHGNGLFAHLARGEAHLQKPGMHKGMAGMAQRLHTDQGHLLARPVDLEALMRLEILLDLRLSRSHPASGAGMTIFCVDLPAHHVPLRPTHDAARVKTMQRCWDQGLFEDMRQGAGHHFELIASRFGAQGTEGRVWL